MADERIIAYLVRGKVWSIQRATPSNPFHPDLSWDQHPAEGPGFDDHYKDITDLDPMPKVGWEYQDGIFIAPTGPTLEEVKKTVRRSLADQVNSFIDIKTEAEGGGNRYDSGFKITTVNLKVEYRAALAAGGLTAEQETGINAKLARIGELEAWMNAVMAEYKAKAAAVLAATTIDEAQVITLDLERFRIGATGEGTMPDPDVYLSEIS